ncbi:MAG: hypothetical protein V8Q65_04780 [Bacteroidaceae bacterium]
MSGTDNLPQVLFSNPLSSPEDFLYRHDKTELSIQTSTVSSMII